MAPLLCLSRPTPCLFNKAGCDQVRNVSFLSTKQPMMGFCHKLCCQAFNIQQYAKTSKISRRAIMKLLGVASGVSFEFAGSYYAKGADTSSQKSAKLCDTTCEQNLENVPMVTTDSGLQYKDIKVGNGPSPPVGFQVIKGLDEGILSMKVGGKRRLYIPGQLAFPKGLNSAPGRPRVPPRSPVIFDVSLEYIPGLEFEE
eukprot:TRINITY_DN2178_c0_g1_i4.p1 TRINITY_DN2178_c0_g1~~TRINITY_DN2178_c0_g1_i4.p1  ORF type:complete len:199 (-),score=39.34 TRINITY_DN2178_c0_g1_i4:228-824(-)